jgi:hypothetical protein
MPISSGTSVAAQWHNISCALNLPMQILKRRANKEHGKDAKRRLRGRRVSFAPDDELHTMHLYDEVSQPASLVCACVPM